LGERATGNDPDAQPIAGEERRVTDTPSFEDWLYTPVEQPRENKLRLKHLKQPIWTENKARFIQRYLYSFVMVTKHGA
jgi:hypothetical protein